MPVLTKQRIDSFWGTVPSLPCRPLIDRHRRMFFLRIPRIAQWMNNVTRGPLAWIPRVVRCACALAVLNVTAPVSQGFAQSGSLKKSPVEIVKNYVRLDQKGARLDSMSFDALMPYIHWREEPAWDRIVIIQGADSPEDYRKWEIINNLEVVIPVIFRVRGLVFLKTATFVPEEHAEEVRFHVQAVGNHWRIIGPVIPPHIGLKRTT